VNGEFFFVPQRLMLHGLRDVDYFDGVIPLRGCLARGSIRVAEDIREFSFG